jgi:hypothetical protein
MMSVALTKRGQKLLTQILPEHFRRMAWLMGLLSESERKTFVGLLTKVLERAAERPGEATLEVHAGGKATGAGKTDIPPASTPNSATGA